MSRQVRVSQKQIRDSKSFSVPLHLFVWVTVGSMLEWFHQKFNSCLTGLISLHYCEKNDASVLLLYKHKFVLFWCFKDENSVFIPNSSPLNCVAGLSVNHLFFFLWQNNIYAWQLSPLEWACCMNGNLNLLECPAFVLDDVRWAHSVGVCRLRIFWMLTLYSLIKARFNIDLLFIATCDSLLRLVRGTWLKCKAKLVLRCSNWLYDLSTK